MTEFINVLWALIIVLSIIWAIAYIAKKSGFMPGASLIAGKQSRLKIIETKALDARHRLILASKDDKEYLLALGPGVITLLDSQDNPDSFKELLEDEGK